MNKRLLSLNASAGTGKTYNLTARYISLLFLNVNPSEILALTFTNKAASEMHERIVNFFEKKQDNIIEIIANYSGLTREQILGKFEQVKIKFLKSDIYISTIDSFFNKILKKFCWYSGIEYDYDITNIDDNILKEELAKEFLKNKILKKRIIQFLLTENINLNNFISILEILYHKDKEFNIKNLKNFSPPSSEKFYELLEGLSELSKFRKNLFEKYFENKSPEQLIESNFLILDKLSEHSWLKKKNIPDYIDIKFKELKKELKNYFLEKEKFILNYLFLSYLLYKKIRKNIIRSGNIVDFIDIENFVFDILKKDNFLNFFYFRLDAKIKHILIDEFQDTSVTQFFIFKPLIDEIASENSGSFFYVGDSKQAIYRFRGGKKELFDYVKSIYLKFGLIEESLNKNYRSREYIVNFINNTFDFVNVKQYVGRDEYKNSGYVEIVNINVESLKGNEKKEEILKSLYNKILFLLEKNVIEEDIAILTFTNDDIKVIESFLLKQDKKIKTIQESALKLINQRSVRAIISFIKFAILKENLYLAEALALIGENPFKNYKIELKSTVFETILNLMKTFSIVDDNTKLFLDISVNFKDFDDFLNNVEKLNIPALSPGKGVRIMTIHKAKGLDFENVIVVDRLGDDKSKNSKLIFDYNDIFLKNIRLRIKGLEKLDNNYNNLILKEKYQEDEDLKNLLYVAFTRGKNSLIVIQKSNGKIKDILNLNDYKKGEIIPSFRKKEIKSEKIEIFIPKINKQNIAPPNIYKPNDFQAIYNGLAIHHFFEFNNKDFILNKYGSFINVDFLEKLFLKAKNNTKYLNLLNGKILREFPLKFEEFKVIDLLIETEDKFIIIDYKFTKPADISNYIFQVNTYANAIKAIFNKKAEGFLYFIDSLEILKVV